MEVFSVKVCSYRYREGCNVNVCLYRTCTDIAWCDRRSFEFEAGLECWCKDGNR